MSLAAGAGTPLPAPGDIEAALEAAAQQAELNVAAAAAIEDPPRLLQLFHQPIRKVRKVRCAVGIPLRESAPGARCRYRYDRGPATFDETGLFSRVDGRWFLDATEDRETR